MNSDDFEALQKRLEFVCENFHNLCRFCLDTNNLLAIFCQVDELTSKQTEAEWVYNDERNIGTMLQKRYVEFDPEQESGLPNNICEKCVDNLVRWHRFQETFSASTKLLLKVRDQFTIKKDPSEISDDDDIGTEVTETEDYILSEDNKIEIEYVQNLPDNATLDNVTIIETVDETFESDEDKVQSSGTADVTSGAGKLHIIDMKVDLLKTSQANIRISKSKNQEFYDASKSAEIAPKRSSTQRGEQCPICGMIVKAKMKHHLMRHADPSGQPFKCSDCGKSYSFKRSLANHIRQVHQNVRYNCEVCRKEFISRDVLRIHKKLHTDEEHRCAICDQVFQQKMYLKKHMVVHDLKKFICNEDDCGKSFRFKEQLKQHMRIHTGEKPFCCNACPKSFRTSSHLKQHRRTHTQEKVYKCKQCPMEYANKKSLERHVSGMHHMDTTDTPVLNKNS